MPAKSPASVRGKSTVPAALYASISKAGKAVPVQEAACMSLSLPPGLGPEQAMRATQGWFPAHPRAWLLSPWARPSPLWDSVYQQALGISPWLKSWMKSSVAATRALILVKRSARSTP